MVGLACLAAVVALVLSTVGDDADSTDDARAAFERADDGAAGDRTIEVEAPTGPVVQNGSYRLTLPSGWVGADVSDGIASAGAELFPPDPQAAEAVDAMLTLTGIRDDAVITPQLVAVDTAIADSSLARFGLMVALSVPGDLGADSPEEATEEFVQGMVDASSGTTVEPSAEVVDLDGRRVGRVVVLEGAVGGPGSVSYVFVEERIMLNFTVAEATAAQLAVFDASAATLTAG